MAAVTLTQMLTHLMVLTATLLLLIQAMSRSPHRTLAPLHPLIPHCHPCQHLLQRDLCSRLTCPKLLSLQATLRT